MSDEPSLLEIKKMISDLADVLDVIHVEMSDIKTELQKLKKNLQQTNLKKGSDETDFMHG
jgi:hypothetical protein|tara:strand:- start:61 stop:240 length:180 start_codon:yes stop_codon:yes gene_type:complete